MSHLYRFQGLRSAPMSWTLAGDEQHHLLKVLRLTPGDGLEIADGLGWVADAIVASTSKHEVWLTIRSESYTPKPDGSKLRVLALGALKPQTVDELLPPLVELGIDRIIVYPFEGMDTSRLGSKVQERWERIVTSACKQCKRAWWPELVWMPSFSAFLEASQVYNHRLVLDPTADQLLAEWRPGGNGAVMAAIGPEKGFAPQEWQALRSFDFIPVRIGGHVLRAVTAAMATAALLPQR